MLWHLTGLRADMAQIRFVLTELKATLSQRDVEAISQKWTEDTKRLHEELYKEALIASRLDDADSHSGHDTSENNPPRI